MGIYTTITNSPIKMPRNTDTNGNALSLTATQTAARYWKDTFGTSRQFAAVRTAADVIRELHYKCCATLHSKCLRDMESLISSKIVEKDVASWMAFIRRINEFSAATDDWWSREFACYTDATDAFSDIIKFTEITLGAEGRQYTALAYQHLDRFSDELDSVLPTENQCHQAIARATAAAFTKIQKCEEGVAQTKLLLVEERKMNRQLEKVLMKSGISLPKQCACGEIYEPENCVEKVESAPRMVKVYDEETDTIIEEAETAGVCCELYRPMWHSHWVKDKTDGEDLVCRNCIFGKVGVCSPCFVPQPKNSKITFVAAKMYKKAYEYAPPLCMCCQSGLNKNCFVWNKNRYLLVPQFATAIKEIVPARRLRDEGYTSIKPSDFREVMADASFPICNVGVMTTTGTNYFGNDYQYENTTGNVLCVRPLH